MSNPGTTHILATKRILSYLTGTRSLGMTYRRGAVDPSLLSIGMETGSNQLSASADADHVGADDRKSVSGWAIMLAGTMIAWSSKRRHVTAINSTESEFYSVLHCALDCVYLRRIMQILGYEQTSPTLIGEKPPPKWQKNDLVSGNHGPAWPSLELAWTKNWVDRLRTSADKRMWSGRRSVVMRTGRRAEFLGVKLGCPHSRCRAVVSDVLCVRLYVHFICVCVYVCMCVCVRT